MPELPSSTKQPLEPAARRRGAAPLHGGVEHNPTEAVELLTPYPDVYVETVLELLNPALRQQLLDVLPRERRERILSTASPENRRQWLRNDAFEENTIGRLMEPALAVFDPT